MGAIYETTAITVFIIAATLGATPVMAVVAIVMIMLSSQQ